MYKFVLRDCALLQTSGPKLEILIIHHYKSAESIGKITLDLQHGLRTEMTIKNSINHNKIMQDKLNTNKKFIFLFYNCSLDIKYIL